MFITFTLYILYTSELSLSYISIFFCLASCFHVDNFWHFNVSSVKRTNTQLLHICGSIQLKTAVEPCSGASPASPNQSNRAFNQSSAPAAAWQERCKHKLSHRPLSYPRQPWDLEEPQPFKCAHTRAGTKLSPRFTVTNVETTPSGAFSYPGNSVFLLIPTFHHHRERDDLW